MKAQPLITVRNVSASARFYCQVLGGAQGHGGDQYEQILIGTDLVLQLHSPEPDANHDALIDASSPAGNGVVLWFETDDFAGLLSRITEHGIPLDRDPFENVFAKQLECWLHDPDGYQVVIAGPSAYLRQPRANQVQIDA